jgi:hypothetical protein
MKKKRTFLFFFWNKINKELKCSVFIFFSKFNHLLFLDDEVDEDIHEYAEVELAFHHVVTFDVTFAQLFWNYDEIIDDLYYPRWMIQMHHH